MSKRRELSMRTIRELLRLALTNDISARDIGRSLRISHPTVQKYVQTIRKAGLNWAAIEQMDDEQLKGVLKSVRGRRANVERPLPDYEYIHQELKKSKCNAVFIMARIQASQSHRLPRRSI